MLIRREDHDVLDNVVNIALKCCNDERGNIESVTSCLMPVCLVKIVVNFKINRRIIMPFFI